MAQISLSRYHPQHQPFSCICKQTAKKPLTGVVGSVYIVPIPQILNHSLHITTYIWHTSFSVVLKTFKRPSKFEEKKRCDIVRSNPPSLASWTWTYTNRWHYVKLWCHTTHRFIFIFIAVAVGPDGQPKVEGVGARLSQDAHNNQHDRKTPASRPIFEVDAEHLAR